MRRYIILFAASALGMTAMAGCSSSSDDTKSTTGGGGGVTVAESAAGTPVAVTAGDTNDTTQFLTVSPDSVGVGPTTFTLTNTGVKQHEMVVLKTDAAIDSLEVGADNRVSEADSVGEVGETDVGKTGTVTLDLAPGKYILVCNIEKHYAQGMRVAFTVTP